MVVAVLDPELHSLPPAANRVTWSSLKWDWIGLRKRPSMAATAGGLPAATGDRVFLVIKNRALDDLDEHLLCSYRNSSLFLCYSTAEAYPNRQWCFRVLELETAPLDSGGFFMFRDRSAHEQLVGDTALPYCFCRHPAKFRIWAPSSAELAMLEVQGNLYGNQVWRMLAVCGVDCNLFLLPQVTLRRAGGLGGGAAAIARSASVAPAAVPVPVGTQVVPAAPPMMGMAGSNDSLELREFKAALLGLLIACAEGVVIKKETQKDKSEEKKKSHYQDSDSERPSNSSSSRSAPCGQSGGRLLSTIGAQIDVGSRSGKRGIEEAESQGSSLEKRLRL